MKLFNEERFEEALVHFESTSELQPERARITTNFGIAYLMLRNNKKSS